MTATSKDLYIDKFDDIGDKYNNAYNRTIKMKHIYIKITTYLKLVII